VDFAARGCDLLDSVSVDINETVSSSTKKTKKKSKKRGGEATEEVPASGVAGVPVFRALTHAAGEMRVKGVEKAAEKFVAMLND
ncbi:unnamed protein product, partial [Amoebophrya sp. A25]